MPFPHFKVMHWHKIAFLLMLFDVFGVLFSYLFALFLRFDFMFSRIPSEYIARYFLIMPFYVPLILLIFYYVRLYKSIWRFASTNELFRLLLSNFAAFCFLVSGTLIFGLRMPISFYAVGFILQIFFTVAIRFSYRFILLERQRAYSDKKPRKHVFYQKTDSEKNRNENNSLGHERPRVMIIGAGSAGQMIARDIEVSKHIQEKVVCFIDDNSNKWGRDIAGIPVVGGKDVIFQAVQKDKIDKIYLTIPTASPQQKKEILDICKETNCELKILPGIYQMVNGEVTTSNLKKVEVEDLLGRDPIKVDMREIFDYVSDKVILVTGGGGSIGSELCRQIAAHNPKQLIVLDIYENNAHSIELELKDRFPDLNLDVLIGSVRDATRIQNIFRQYKPNIVYHAAAHKHVPLMEDSPNESIKNNVIGTYKTAYAAMMNGTDKFVLISTDKAVNPTNIMGASKRLCEMVIQTFDKQIKDGNPELLPDIRSHSINQTHFATNFIPHTEYVAVRFGNVLGSNGSVIPRFKEQIAKGGPVTVTHKDIIRYFMTIPEAVSLVLQAGTYAKGGEIFVLDMGDPVKIDTLARNLILLSGYQPDLDIKIIYTGLRPGEKLYEEKLMAEEGIRKTKNKLIHIGQPIKFDELEFISQIEDIANAAYSESIDIKRLVSSVVTTYKYNK